MAPHNCKRVHYTTLLVGNLVVKVRRERTAGVSNLTQGMANPDGLACFEFTNLVEVQKSVGVAQPVSDLDTFPVVSGVPIYSGNGTSDWRENGSAYICLEIDSAMTATTT